MGGAGESEVHDFLCTGGWVDFSSTGYGWEALLARDGCKGGAISLDLDSWADELALCLEFLAFCSS